MAGFAHADPTTVTVSTSTTEVLPQKRTRTGLIVENKSADDLGYGWRTMDGSGNITIAGSFTLAAGKQLFLVGGAALASALVMISPVGGSDVVVQDW